MREITLGIDIGGTNTKLGLVDGKGHILAQSDFSTAAYKERSIEEYFRDLAREAHHLIDRVQDVELVAIGLGAPNGNYFSCTIEYAPNLPWKGHYQVSELLGQHFPDTPIYLTNDANAAALGEMVYGAARGLSDFIVITLGTGLGSGIVSGGKLVYGHDGFAGEMGHVTAIPDGRRCGCGKLGCLETYASAGGIVQTALDLLSASSNPSILRKYTSEELDVPQIAEAARAGDAIAKDVFEQTGKILGREMANATAYFSPKAFFLFGGVTHAGDILFEPIRRHMEANMFVAFRGKVSVQPSAFAGAEAAILGASALALDSVARNREKVLA